LSLGRGLLGRFHAAFVHGRRSRRIAEVVAAALEPLGRGTLLDVGCGDGGVAALIAERWGGTPLGIEIHARRRVAIPFAIFDGRRIPVTDHGVDFVLLADVLHHDEEPVRLLREAARVARRSVVVKDHCADSAWDRLILTVMDWVGNAPHGVARPGRYVRSEDWTRLAEEAGLRVAARMRLDGLYPPVAESVFGRRAHVLLTLVPSEPAVRSVAR
jgi:SAM-dependent methyltransferase